jgi:predicted sulfurtransferase
MSEIKHTFLYPLLQSLSLSALPYLSDLQIVTYGFNPLDAPLELGGTHLTPQEFHDSMADENSVVVDVRNFNETAIGRFQPPGALTMDTKVCTLNQCNTGLFYSTLSHCHISVIYCSL